MRRAVLAAMAVAGIAAAVLVVMVAWTPRGHQPTTPEGLVQLAVLVAAAVLVVRRATGKR